MRIKSYFTDSVEEAIEHARVELGEDAMLMNSKKTEPELRALGAYEVVFGVTSEVASASSTVLPRKIAVPPELGGPERKRPMHGSGGISKGLGALLTATQPVFLGPAAGLEQQRGVVQRELAQRELIQGELVQGELDPAGALSRELADLRAQIEAVKRSMFQVPEAYPAESGDEAEGDALAAPLDFGGQPAAPPLTDAQQIGQQLCAGGFSEEMGAEIGEAVAERLAFETHQSYAPEVREALLYAELARRFRVAPGLLLPETAAGPAGRAVLFAGPAGSGKTSSLLKLALRYSLTGRLPLQILSLDTMRVGAWEQLAAYARIAGLAFHVIHNPAALGQALAEYRGKKLVLIDTPGLSPAEWQEMPELAATVARELARDNMLEVQLVLSAAQRPAIVQRALAQFSVMRPAKLLLTHLDEVDAPGVALELAMRAALPVSYLAGGQQIPEDLEEASQDRLLKPFACASLPRIASAA